MREVLHVGLLLSIGGLVLVAIGLGWAGHKIKSSKDKHLAPPDPTLKIGQPPFDALADVAFPGWKSLYELISAGAWMVFGGTIVGVIGAVLVAIGSWRGC